MRVDYSWPTRHSTHVYKSAPKLKMGIKKFREHLADAHMLGMVEAFEAVQKTIMNTPDLTIDELRGDIHLIVTEVMTKFRRNNNPEMDTPTLESTLKREGLYGKKEDNAETSGATLC